jgi:hypothetical protein
MDNKQWNKEPDENADAQNKKGSQAPNTDRDYKVLNPDGSLPDIPDEDVSGKGALDGTVGLGT